MLSITFQNAVLTAQMVLIMDESQSLTQWTPHNKYHCQANKFVFTVWFTSTASRAPETLTWHTPKLTDYANIECGNLCTTLPCSRMSGNCHSTIVYQEWVAAWPYNITQAVNLLHHRRHQAGS